MAKQSDALLKQLAQALDRERGIDVGLLDEIRSHHVNQLNVLQEEWKSKTAEINNRMEADLAAVRTRSEAEIKDVDDMMSALTSVSKIVVDKIDTYLAKLHSATTIIDVKPNTGVLPKTPVGAGVSTGDGSALIGAAKAVDDSTTAE